MTVKCVSIGGSEIHVVNCLLYLSVLIYVCHPSSWDFLLKTLQILKFIFQLSQTWFLLWFKKVFLQYIFTLSHFSQRHRKIEVAGLIPMHHLFLSVGGSVPTAWLCWASSSVQQHCALHLQRACQLFEMCHGTWGWPHNFLEEVGNPWSHQKGLSTNDTMQAPQ